MSGYLPSYSELVTGSASTTSGAVTTLISAPSEGAICVSGLQLGRTDAGGAITVTLNDTVASSFVLPASSNGGGVRDIVFDAPLLVAPKTALTFVASSGINALLATAQGFLKN